MRVIMAQFNIKPEALKNFEHKLRRLARTRRWRREPLPDMPSGKDFMQNLPSWVAAPPQRQKLHLVGPYVSAN